MRYLPASSGSKVTPAPTGFPVFSERAQPRIVTSDIWSFFRYEARRTIPNHDHRSKVTTLIANAQEYFLAAQNPRLSSRPVLYYYAFYNLVKAFLFLRGRPEVVGRIVRHGLTDPSGAQIGKMMFRDRQVSVRNPPGTHDVNLLPILLREFVNVQVADRTSYRVLELLSLLPGIHRTFCRVAKSSPLFCPAGGFDLLREDGKYLVRLVLNRAERDVLNTKSRLLGDPAFASAFRQVQAGKREEIWCESEKFPGWGRGVPGALKNLRTACLATTIAPLLTNVGYRYYIALHGGHRELAGIPAMFMIMFYLGSITRYQPYHFDSIFSGGFRWLVNEFLETQPSQFVYLIGSLLAGTEVVRPFGGTLLI